MLIRGSIVLVPSGLEDEKVGFLQFVFWLNGKVEFGLYSLSWFSSVRPRGCFRVASKGISFAAVCCEFTGKEA